MSRTYMNIKAGYEPIFSDFMSDRTTYIRPMALKYIENIRINLQLLHEFFKRLNSKADTSPGGVDDLD